eukprot:TRINITY_DN70702_c0_g1_i1.p1 TRINITY_DN70702_c0_g1~~TRINITY_DN70702_c0_g1_i1.p1  ORF type:complete len:774 (+),score=374.59 TRINITY_DN70702_c0_g1_i1:92-2323(+)
MAAAAGAQAASASEADSRLRQYNVTKQAFFQQEDTLHALSSSTEFSERMQQWREQASARFASEYDQCQRQLDMLQRQAAVEPGSYWNSRMIAKHCNLMLDERRLIRKDQGQLPTDRPSWSDVVKLTSTLNNLKTKGFISQKQVKFIEQVENQLKNCFFEGRELRRITEALATKLSEEIEQQTMTADLTKHEHVIADLLPDLENCENLLEAAQLNGDMALAEEIAYNQIALHQRLLGIVQEQYPIIRKRQEDSKEFKRRRRWAIFRMANRDVASVVELKFRQIEACEEDTQKIKFQVENYSQDDRQQRRRFDLDRSESDKFLAENEKLQKEQWARIERLQQELRQAQEELGRLADQRKREIERRVVLTEKEEGRLQGHGAFLACSRAYLDNLEATIENAERAKDIAKAINDFILDGCDNVALKFDRTEAMLNEMATRVNRQYLKQFTDYYLALGRLMYKKEKKRSQLSQTIEDCHIKLEMSIDTIDPMAKKYAQQKKNMTEQRRILDAELEQLQSRMRTSSKEFEPVALGLRELGIPFVHPQEILEKSALDRMSKITDFRDLANLTEQRIERQLEEEAATINAEKEAHKVKVRAAQRAQRQRQLEPRPPGAPPGTDKAFPGKYQAAAYQRYQHMVDGVLSAGQEAPEGAVVPAKTPAAVAAAAAAAEEQQTVAPLPKRLEGRMVQALYAYKARATDELSFSKGDKIVVINEGGEEGWYYGICNQKTGLFPANYVTLAPEELEAP